VRFIRKLLFINIVMFLAREMLYKLRAVLGFEFVAKITWRV
jgi:hypothetical protein